MLAQWQEVYEQSWGKGRAGNAIGGFVFQWTDGWWKVGQEKNLDDPRHHATWSNAAYAYDWAPGENNMNEEWFGITALGEPDGRGLYHVRPRTAYYVLQQAFRLDPYAEDTTLERMRRALRRHPARATTRRAISRTRRWRASTRSSGCASPTCACTFDSSVSRGNSAPCAGPTTVFDHTESFFLDFVLQPIAKIYARLSLNIVGNVGAEPPRSDLLREPQSRRGARRLASDAAARPPRRTRRRPAPRRRPRSRS